MTKCVFEFKLSNNQIRRLKEGQDVSVKYEVADEMDKIPSTLVMKLSSDDVSNTFKIEDQLE